jgi:hypothetical protein
VKNRIIVIAAVAVTAFLLGFLPQYAKGRRLGNEMETARLEISAAQLRDLASLAYVHASQKNFGLAAGSATRFFNRARELANQAPDDARRNALSGLLADRDQITARLAKGDAAAVADLEALYLKTRDATLPAAGQ